MEDNLIGRNFRGYESISYGIEIGKEIPSNLGNVVVLNLFSIDNLYGTMFSILSRHDKDFLRLLEIGLYETHGFVSEGC